MINGGRNVSVSYRRCQPHDILLILYTCAQQAAIAMKMEPRFVINRLLDLDKTMVRSAKAAERESKYGKK